MTTPIGSKKVLRIHIIPGQPILLLPAHTNTRTHNKQIWDFVGAFVFGFGQQKSEITQEKAQGRERSHSDSLLPLLLSWKEELLFGFIVSQNKRRRDHPFMDDPHSFEESSSMCGVFWDFTCSQRDDETH
jgi:hypothetical protein